MGHGTSANESVNPVSVQGFEFLEDSSVATDTGQEGVATGEVRMTMARTKRMAQ